MMKFATGLLPALVLIGCAPEPLLEYSTDGVPMVLLPASRAGLDDQRARFREVYCALNEERGDALPDYMPCEEVLVRLRGEGEPAGKPVNVAVSTSRMTMLLAPGFGWNCFSEYLDVRNTVRDHLMSQGYRLGNLNIDALSSSTRNARLIRDQVMAMSEEQLSGPLVLLGYSKGAPDILEAIVEYPELAARVDAVVSMAGSVGGSPLANKGKQWQANLLRYFPGSDCDSGDEGAVESMRPDVRRLWLAKHDLPPGISYYSIVTYPEPGKISALLKSAYKDLSQVDPRNDSQVIYYDQFIPGSSVLAFINADHWAVDVPIDRSHEFIAATIVDENDFPRELMAESIVRFVEEDLARQAADAVSETSAAPQ